VAVRIKTTVRGEIRFEPGSSHTAVGRANHSATETSVIMPTERQTDIQTDGHQATLAYTACPSRDAEAALHGRNSDIAADIQCSVIMSVVAVLGER